MLSAVKSSSASFNEVVLVNNAGSISHIGACVETPSLADMRSYIDLNVTSCLWFSIRLIRFAKARANRPTIVNVSSLVALQPFASLGIYSAGKAAREVYHSVLAAEADSRGSKILNYAPGPLETDMTNEIRMSPGLDSSLRPGYETKLVDPCDSARALVQFLSSDDYQSGAHADFYELDRTLARTLA
jgi:sepiapterin reductase